MNRILTSITEHESVLILFLLAFFVALLALTLKAIRDSNRIKRRFGELLDGARGENLETLLHNHLSERMQIQSQIDGLTKQAQDLEAKVRRTKRYLGFVRYDAFEDVGGEQSFALALYDDEGDGAVITSLVGRTDCRVYCKSLSGGQAERSLSDEERRAVDNAAGRPRATERN